MDILQITVIRMILEPVLQMSQRIGVLFFIGAADSERNDCLQVVWVEFVGFFKCDDGEYVLVVFLVLLA